MKNDLVLKNRLKMARAEKGLSQSDLAEMIGVSRNTCLLYTSDTNMDSGGNLWCGIRCYSGLEAGKTV